MLPSNILQQVVTYQKSGLAYLLNKFCAISIANKKFQNFQDFIGNLGNQVNFTLPTRYTTIASLNAQFQSTQQRFHTLTVDQPASTSYAFSSEQFVYNVEQFMMDFGRSAIVNIGTTVEKNILKNFDSSVPVLVNEVPSGALHTESGPYRFFGNGRDPINSFGQLATMKAYFDNYGAARDDHRCILSDIAAPQISNTGLNQFALDRNNELANSWQIGSFQSVDYYTSNLLPIHHAGTVGNESQTLTVVSTDDPSGANITQITLSGATASDLNAIKSGDLAQFNDNVSGQPNLRYLTFIGYAESANPVQIRITANAAADGSGNVVLSIYPALCAQSGNPNQNILYNIVAGMQLDVLPDHKCGIIYSGDAFYLGMPQLQNMSPFATANEADPDSGISVRFYHGAVFGKNEMGFIHDCIYGSTLVPEYCMRVVFPITQ